MEDGAIMSDSFMDSYRKNNFKKYPEEYFEGEIDELEEEN